MIVLGNGHLGKFLVERLNAKLYADDLMKFNLSSHEDIIINTAAKTNLPFCENNPLEAFRSNVQGAIHAFREAKKHNSMFIQLSSGCIWSGPYKNGKPFEPNDEPSPDCFYSWTKVSADSIMLQECGGYKLLILKPRQLYSHIDSNRNMLVKIRGYDNLLDTHNSMTSVETIAKTIETVIKEPKITIGGLTMNVYERGVTSPYNVGIMLHLAGYRNMPGKLTKENLDSWHYPKRVDAVIHDALFEELVNPPAIADELARNIALLRKPNA